MYRNIMPAAGLQQTGQDSVDLKILASGYQHGTAAQICVDQQQLPGFKGNSRLLGA